MWLAIFSGLFSIPSLCGLFVGLWEASRFLRRRPHIRWERLALLGLILTGRWWMGYLRRLDTDEPKPLAPVRQGTALGKGGVRLEWEQFGPEDAPALLLTHGWSLTHDTWYYQKKALAGEFRVIVWDLRGTGRSEAPADRDYTMDTVVEDLVAVFDATEAGRHPAGCVLAGHSVGAMILPLFAARYPERMGTVRGLVMIAGTDTPLLETMWGRRWLVPMRFRFWEPLARGIARFPRPVEAMVRLIWQMGCVHAALMFGTHVGRESRGQDNLVADRCAHFSMRAAALGALSCFAFDAQEEMRLVRVPTLLLTGDCDRNMPPDQQRAMAARLAQPVLSRISNSGHLSLLECHEEVTGRMRAFARQCLAAK